MGDFMIIRFIACIGLTLLLSQTAFAGTYKRDAKAGRTTTIDRVYIYLKADCTGAALPRLKLGKKPKHGSVAFKKTSWKSTNKSNRCYGKTVKGLAINYTPNRGFRGEDRFRLDTRFFAYQGSPRFTVNSDTFKITVK